MGVYAMRYCLKKGALPDYLIEMTRQGCCPVLLKSSFYEYGGKICVSCATEGLVSLRRELDAAEGCEDMRLLLTRLRACLEALREAEDWLVPSAVLSLRLDGIWLDRSGRVRLPLLPSGMTPFEAVTSLCSQISFTCPGFSTDLVNRRLFAQAGNGTLSTAEMLRTLSAWSFELGGAARG